MRSLRAGTAAGILGFVLLCAGWWLSATAETKPAGGAAAAHLFTTAGLSPSLESRLQQLLALRPVVPRSRLPVPPLRDLRTLPHGTTCPVAAGGFCSLTPCVQFAGRGSGTVFRSAVIAARVGGPAVLLLSQTAATNRHAPQPAGPTCQGHPGPSQTLPVTGA
jgi:hypothetical protein